MVERRREMATAIQQGPYTPLNEETVFCVRWAGAFCWVLLGLIAFSFLLAAVPVSGVSDVPAYARSIMYLSLGYHFDDVRAHLYDTSPPPPQF